MQVPVLRRDVFGETCRLFVVYWERLVVLGETCCIRGERERRVVFIVYWKRPVVYGETCILGETCCIG